MPMTITATCGHRIPDHDDKYSITRKGYNRKGERCLFHDVVCMKCKRFYLRWDDILYTEAEEQAWVRYEEE